MIMLEHRRERALQCSWQRKAIIARRCREVFQLTGEEGMRRFRLWRVP